MRTFMAFLIGLSACDSAAREPRRQQTPASDKRLAGDGGAANHPQGNAQNSRSLLGKMLTLNVDQPGAQPTIVQTGLRNPWRYAFDSDTHALYIADKILAAPDRIHPRRRLLHYRRPCLPRQSHPEPKRPILAAYEQPLRISCR